jgi:enoyl-CoA hydratase/carnithine racemase
MEELLEVARSFEDDLETTAVVLTGSPTTFSAGMDLTDPRTMEAMHAPLGERRRLMAYGPKLCGAWESMEQVTIAAIEGFCVGGGVSLAVACDFRIMARGAIVRVPELGLGMNMSWQTLPRLVHLVGPARSKQIVILAEKVNSEQALTWGLVEAVADDGRAVSEAMEWAEKIAAMPPLPVRMTKQTINMASTAFDNAVSHMDVDQFMLCQMTEDQAEGLSAFRDRRKGSFKGR